MSQELEALLKRKAEEGEREKEAMRVDWSQRQEARELALRQQLEEESGDRLRREQERMGRQLDELAGREKKAQAERERYAEEQEKQTQEMRLEKEVLAKRWADRSDMDQRQLEELRSEKQELAQKAEMAAQQAEVQMAAMKKRTEATKAARQARCF